MSGSSSANGSVFPTKHLFNPFEAGEVDVSRAANKHTRTPTLIGASTRFATARRFVTRCCSPWSWRRRCLEQRQTWRKQGCPPAQDLHETCHPTTPQVSCSTSPIPRIVHLHKFQTSPEHTRYDSWGALDIPLFRQQTWRLDGLLRWRR